MIVLLLLAALLAPAPMWAQSKKTPTKAAPAKPVKPVKPAKPAAPVSYPVLSLQVNGLKNFTEAQVLAVAGLKVGDVAKKETFDAARDRLLATGAFEDVGYKYTATKDKKGFAAVLQVTEVQPCIPVRFEDLPGTAGDLNAALLKSDPLYGPRIPGTRNVVDRYTRVLQEYFANNGFTEEIAGSVAADETGTLMVLFRPKRPPPSVAEVTFTGNKAFPTQVLQKEIAGVAVGIIYRATQFQKLLDYSIRPMYENKGYLRVSFPKLETTPVKDVTGVAVKVTVEEGAVYKLDAVNFAGTPVDARAFGKIAGFKTGEAFNLGAVEEGREQVMKGLRKAGYMRAKSEWERKTDDAAKTVSLTLRIDAGATYTFGKLNVQGLDLETEPMIRKLWTLKYGAPFNADYPDYFLQRVREDGVFDNLGKTKSEIKADDENKTVDVTLFFQGAPSQDGRPGGPRRRKQR